VRLGTAERLVNLVAILCILSWRIFWITMLNRTSAGAINRGFADYALTGWFWNQTGGTVMDAASTSTPTIEFTTPDGATHEFREDYIILCQGKRSFCFIRDFDPGQQVPVVYNPGSPKMAYVHDWALSSTVITVFLETAAELFFVLMMVVMVRRRPIRAAVRFGGDEDEPRTD
jgi:hypothetical protein